MEELEKLKKEVIDLGRNLPVHRDYEAHDIAIKILALQEQRKANEKLENIIVVLGDINQNLPL